MPYSLCAVGSFLDSPTLTSLFKRKLLSSLSLPCRFVFCFAPRACYITPTHHTQTPHTHTPRTQQTHTNSVHHALAPSHIHHTQTPTHITHVARHARLHRLSVLRSPLCCPSRPCISYLLPSPSSLSTPFFCTFLCSMSAVLILLWN